MILSKYAIPSLTVIVTDIKNLMWRHFVDVVAYIFVVILLLFYCLLCIVYFTVCIVLLLRHNKR